jgi:hypothetical protein
MALRCETPIDDAARVAGLRLCAPLVSAMITEFADPTTDPAIARALLADLRPLAPALGEIEGAGVGTEAGSQVAKLFNAIIAVFQVWSKSTTLTRSFHVA